MKDQIDEKTILHKIGNYYAEVQILVEEIFDQYNKDEIFDVEKIAMIKNKSFLIGRYINNNLDLNE